MKLQYMYQICRVLGTIVMLLPLRRIWSSLVILLPSGVISLNQAHKNESNQQKAAEQLEKLCRDKKGTYNSVTSSRTMSTTLSQEQYLEQTGNHAGHFLFHDSVERILTKSSKPSRVPTISLSVFMTMWILEPIHLSTSSVRWKKGGRKAEVRDPVKLRCFLVFLFCTLWQPYLYVY